MKYSLDKRNLILIFTFATRLTLSMPILWPSLRLFYYAPVLVIAAYSRSLKTAVWCAFLAGFIIDLFNPALSFGIHSLTFCTAIFVLNYLKKHFFADSLSTLFLMTFFASALSTIISLFLFQFFLNIHLFSWFWIWTDVIVMSLLDGVYAFTLFQLPQLILGKKPRKGKDYFLSEVKS